ncbi:uncharacterized protein LOC126785757 [Argentina anserina]|uniref:uncharacterized protein LOC126785757 n=1 Tax=Argentina anserina TaxID=57926 RepID=UPI0021763691|nr:uncharacterized protein LOC126785757 [Potentilla anserina]
MPLMEAEQIMELLDSFWFEHEILKKQPYSASSSRFEADLVHESEEQPSKPEVLRIPSLHTRSMSEDLSSKTSFMNCGSLSPDSVLQRPKLSTILSGKEATKSIKDIPVQKHEIESSRKAKIERRRKKGGSKSLTDLQFEELKGFMDLGFIFSEEDKNTNLASIIPGLKKFGKKDEGEEGEEAFDDESAISRPYLSEAWEVMEKRKKEKKPLMDWRFPSLSNEIDMKDNLRWWAHTVASTVR